jgi:hypothetical protein
MPWLPHKGILRTSLHHLSWASVPKAECRQKISRRRCATR